MEEGIGAALGTVGALFVPEPCELDESPEDIEVDGPEKVSKVRAVEDEPCDAFAFEGELDVG